MTAESATIQMNRPDTVTPWGLRLQGGKEYLAPLIVGKVTKDSVADRSGLREGDFLVRISGLMAEEMTHKEAQQAILNSGNFLELFIERTSARIWTPTITTSNDANKSLKYSLEHNQQTASHPEAKYNTAGKPFGGIAPNGTVKIANNMQYNTPKPLYSNKSAAEAFQQQMESKQVSENQDHSDQEPAYLRSETLKLIQANEQNKNGTPKTLPERPLKNESTVTNTESPFCHKCRRSIHGVFCKAANQMLHQECFVCSTCGANLKNKGYYCISNKLYCEIHAKAISNNYFGAAPPVDPSVFAPLAPQLDVSPRSIDPVIAAYQPEVLKKGPILHTPRGTNLSPASRGVPTYSPKTGVYNKPSSRGNETSEIIGYPTHREASPTHLLAPMQNLNIVKHQSDNYHQKSPIINPNLKPADQNSNSGLQPFNPPRRGRGIVKHSNDVPRIPQCKLCNKEIRGPFILASNECWCMDHFVCSVDSCRRKLIDVGYVELDEHDRVCCEYCYENKFAPKCDQCGHAIIEECLKAINCYFHPTCFKCSKCLSAIGNGAFYVEKGQILCEKDWAANFTTKCHNCQFPIENGDRFVEALGSAFHADCFNCTVCQKSLEGVTFYGKGGRSYCQNHI